MFPDRLALLRCPECGPEATLAADPVLERGDDGEWIDAVLTCPRCARWFRVEDGIADLVRDGLREVEEDRRFLARHADRIGSGIAEAGRPLGLHGAVPPRSPEDERIVEEGRHWGRFMRRFWDVGDRSIFDIRVKGTHPSFFVKGIVEPDERDRTRRYGNFPTSTGEILFGRLGALRGEFGVDIGCGGGQFGLEAAQQGVTMIGFDPSFEEVQLGRRHAREMGVQNIDYIRAEPANPPLQNGVFALVMAKDSLHHVPNLAHVMPRLLRLMSTEGVFVCHEHTSRAERKDRISAWLDRRFVPRLRRLYKTTEVPTELLRDSANEDISSHEIRPLLARHLEPLAQVEDLFLANELEMYIHYLSRKRRLPTMLARVAGKALERMLLLMGERQHLSFVGRRRQARP